MAVLNRIDNKIRTISRREIPDAIAPDDTSTYTESDAIRNNIIHYVA
jgi:hypothetical protein